MSNFDKHVLAFSPTHIHFGPIQRLQSIRKIINFWYTFGWKWWVISFCDYLGLSDACSYDVDDVIGRADRFGFQNFCSPASRGQPRAFRQIEVSRHFLDFWEKFCSKFWIFLYILYIKTSPSAQNREKSASLGRLHLPHRLLGWALSSKKPEGCWP